jgi:hypothetical protein
LEGRSGIQNKYYFSTCLVSRWKFWHNHNTSLLLLFFNVNLEDIYFFLFCHFLCVHMVLNCGCVCHGCNCTVNLYIASKYGWCDHTCDCDAVTVIFLNYNIAAGIAVSDHKTLCLFIYDLMNKSNIFGFCNLFFLLFLKARVVG